MLDPVSAPSEAASDAIEAHVESGSLSAMATPVEPVATELPGSFAPEAALIAPTSSTDGTGARNAISRPPRRSPVEWVAIVVASASVLWAIWLLLFYRR